MDHSTGLPVPSICGHTCYSNQSQQEYLSTPKSYPVKESKILIMLCVLRMELSNVWLTFIYNLFAIRVNLTNCEDFNSDFLLWEMLGYLYSLNANSWVTTTYNEGKEDFIITIFLYFLLDY